MRDNRVLGHEFTGVVEAIGEDVASLSKGQRVVVNPSLSCLKCECCRAGHSHQCANTHFLGIDRDGAFAEEIVVPQSIVHPLSREIPFSVGTFAEPIAAGMAVLEAGLLSSDRILVFGAGRIAALTGEILDYAGFTNAAISSEIPDSDSALSDAIIETCGIGDDAECLFRTLRPRGTLVIKSREPTEVSIPILPAIARQVTIKAVKYGPFAKALCFLEHQADWCDAQLGDPWRLDDFEEAFDLARRSEREKIWFKIGD